MLGATRSSPPAALQSGDEPIVGERREILLGIVGRPCLSDPGLGVDITVRSDPTTLTAVWVGDLPLGAFKG